MTDYIWQKCKILTDWQPNKHTYEFIDCRQITDGQGGVVSMDMIRQDNNERVYFLGLTLGLEFIWVVEKYTQEVKG